MGKVDEKKMEKEEEDTERKIELKRLRESEE